MNESTATQSNRTELHAYLRGGGELHARHGLPVDRFKTAYVVKAGPLQEEGSLHTIGTCLTKGPMPGDTILDVLTFERRGTEVLITSLRQTKSADYAFDDDGTPHYKRQLTGPGPAPGFDRVSVSGRAGSWGTLGDDTYDDGSADYLLTQIVAELFFGSNWRMAQIYWDATPVADPTKEGEYFPFDPVATVDLLNWEHAREEEPELPGWDFYRRLGHEAWERDDQLRAEAEGGQS